jgi:tetratricopeptide (TPR) repeat protein
LVLLSLGLLAGLAGWNFQAEQHLRRAEKALEQRAYEDALWHVESYLRMKPNQARAHFLAAQAARRLQRYDKATDHLHACRLCGWDPEAIDLEHTLIALQRGEAGVEPVLWSRVRNGDPHTLPILEVLIQYYLDTYRLNRALECLNNYLERRPDDLHALLGRAYVWERMLYFADALNDYRRAVESHSDSEAARLRLAKTLLIAGTPGEALDQFKHLYKGHADQPEVRLGMAQRPRAFWTNFWRNGPTTQRPYGSEANWPWTRSKHRKRRTGCGKRCGGRLTTGRPTTAFTNACFNKVAKKRPDTTVPT